MRAALIIVVATLFSGSVAFAQEGVGAGRMEISAFPGGGMYFTSSSNDAEPTFGTYTIGGAFTWNLNSRFGVEGEVGNAVGVEQSIEFNGATLAKQHAPCFFGYSANAVVSPWGNYHALVPYVTGGVGALRILDTDEVAALGITAPTNYLTGNAGGGLKWFASRHWGARIDYRLMAVNDKNTAPEFFGRTEVRYAHRVYAGLLFTR